MGSYALSGLGFFFFTEAVLSETEKQLNRSTNIGGYGFAVTPVVGLRRQDDELPAPVPGMKAGTRRPTNASHCFGAGHDAPTIKYVTAAFRNLACEVTTYYSLLTSHHIPASNNGDTSISGLSGCSPSKQVQP